MRIATVSASSQKSYDWCQWKWFIRYCLKFQEEAGPAALIGSIVHKYLEIISLFAVDNRNNNTDIWPDPEELWEQCFNEYFLESPEIADGIDQSKINSIIKGLMDLIHGNYTPYTTNTIASEAQFDIPLVSPLFKVDGTKDEYIKVIGKIDRVDELDKDSIEIIDYKTGRRQNFGSNSKEKINSLTLTEDIQPRMYGLAAKTLYPQYKNILITFIYLADGGPVTATLTDEDHETTMEFLKDKILEIKKVSDPKQTISWKCNKLCWYGKTGLCNNLWEEKEKYGVQFLEDKYSVLNGK